MYKIISNTVNLGLHTRPKSL